jgi:hypothetical protein
VAIAYATRKDVYDFGLPRGTVGLPPRIVASATAATDILELNDHGFDTDDVVRVRAPDGSDLPAPLDAATTYFVLSVSDTEFQLSLTKGGDVVDITEDGDGFLAWTPLPFDRVLEWASRFVDPFIPAHAVPLEQPIPMSVVGAVAALAAKTLQRISGDTSVSVSDAEQTAMAQMQRWAAGVPLRDATATRPTNCAVAAPIPRDRGGQVWRRDRV